MIDSDDRGAVNLVDVVMITVTLVALVVMAPVLNRFTAMVTAEADPFSALLLAAFIPLLVISLIITVGESAGGA
jgi:uncharacterized membrane protein